MGLEKNLLESKLKLIIDTKKERDRITNSGTDSTLALKMVLEYLDSKNLNDTREILRRINAGESE